MSNCFLSDLLISDASCTPLVALALTEAACTSLGSVIVIAEDGCTGSMLVLAEAGCGSTEPLLVLADIHHFIIINALYHKDPHPQLYGQVDQSIQSTGQSSFL